MKKKSYTYIYKGEFIMYCSKCGKEVEETVNFCPSCGTKIINPDNLKTETTNNSKYQSIKYSRMDLDNPNDVPTTGLMVLSFIIPIVGIILYCLWSHDFPKKAKCCLKGFIGSIVFWAIISCCIISAGVSQMKETHYYYDDDFFSHVVEVID